MARHRGSHPATLCEEVIENGSWRYGSRMMMVIYCDVGMQIFVDGREEGRSSAKGSDAAPVSAHRASGFGACTSASVKVQNLDPNFNL